MIRIYDTKMHKKVDLDTIEPGKIRMYVCGPTVYNFIHIGNARTFISFDTIRRYLEWRGFDVTFVQNVTDVDDKIINRANEEGKTAAEVASFYGNAFIEDMHAINVEDPTIRPYATEEIPAMIELVQELVDSEHAYVVDGDVYFSVRSFPSYGSLSGRNIDEMESGHRELRAGNSIEDRKRDPLDFALWKAAKPGEPSWQSPWGLGRPGWHIECSAMSRKYLGLPFDIHGGGSDLVFPHHENERAQSEAASGTTFANHWMHSGMLQIDGEKMSKSLGNFKLLRDVLKVVDANVLRFLMLQTHYRSPLDFSKDRLDEAATALSRIVTTVENLDWACTNASGNVDVVDHDAVSSLNENLKAGFVEAMDDDFNTSKALGIVFDTIAKINAMISGKTLSAEDATAVKGVRGSIVEIMNVLGIDMDAEIDAQKGAHQEYPQALFDLAQELAGYAGDDGQAAIQALLDARADARAQKNWAVADAVRDRMGELGFVIEDTPQGARVSFEG